VFPAINNNVGLCAQKEKDLRKIIVTTWITLDGFLAGSKGEMDWVMVDQASEGCIQTSGDFDTSR
jgi:hypothetical protein